MCAYESVCGACVHEMAVQVQTARVGARVRRVHIPVSAPLLYFWELSGYRNAVLGDAFERDGVNGICEKDKTYVQYIHFLFKSNRTK